MELYDLNPESNNYRIIDYNKRNSPSIYQGMVTQEPNEQVNTIVHEKYWEVDSSYVYLGGIKSSSYIADSTWVVIFDLWEYKSEIPCTTYVAFPKIA